MTDVIIPLGSESASGNDELRILLRSIHRNLDAYPFIHLVTDFCPDWIDRVIVDVIPFPDKADDNKDENLIDKTLCAIERRGLESFVWCADDNVFMRKVKPEAIPVLYNVRGPECFDGAASPWSKRVRNTMEYFGLDCNFESHAPQFFQCAGIRARKMREIEDKWRGVPGMTVMTCLRCIGYVPKKYVDLIDDQRIFKETAETEDSVAGLKFDKMFLGYNDSAFLNGLRERLFTIFPEKSKYEL